MHTLSKPRLRHCTIVSDPEESHITLVVGRNHLRLEQAEGTRDEFFNLKSFFDGHHSIDQISRLTGISCNDVIDVASTLEVAGLLQQRQLSSDIDIGEFLNIVEDSSIMWRRQIGLHRLFGELDSRLLRKEVFLGLLLETYHYVRLLSPMLIQVAQEWKESLFKSVVINYAQEEMDHHLDYQVVLDTVPRLKDRVANSHPTVGTLSLIRNFESIGRRSPLSLVCCLQLIEARSFEGEDAENHLLQIASRYELEELVVPFVHHMRADLDLAHSSLLAEALADVDKLPAEIVHEAVNDMHDLKHCFDEFHDVIIKYYSDISNYIPRPRVDFFAL